MDKRKENRIDYGKRELRGNKQTKEECTMRQRLAFVGAANKKTCELITSKVSRKDLALEDFIEEQTPKYAQLYVDVPISESYRMYNPGCGCAFCEGVYALLKERFLDPDLQDLKEEQEIATMEDPSYEEEDCEKTKEIRFEFTDKGFDQIKALIRILVEELKNNKK